MLADRYCIRANNKGLWGRNGSGIVHDVLLANELHLALSTPA